MSLRKISVLAVAMVLVCSTSAWATNFQLNAVVSKAYNADFSQTPLDRGGPYSATPDSIAAAPVTSQSAVSGATTYQVDFYVNVSNISAGMRGFGNIAWDITLGPGLSQSIGWTPDASNTDTNGATNVPNNGSASLWFANADAGVAGDLKGIIQTITAITSPTATDFRAKVGQQQGSTPFSNSVSSCVNSTGWAGAGQNMTFLGSIFVDWNGSAPTSIQANLTGASNADNSGVLVVDAQAVFGAAQVNLVPVPEPSTFALLGMGAVGLVTVIRRRKA